jgi:hypothetical protein
MVAARAGWTGTSRRDPRNPATAAARMVRLIRTS